MDNNNQVRLINWEEMPKEKLTDKLERRIISGEKLMLTHVYLKKGCIIPMHQHHNEQLSYILSGEMLFWFGSEDAEPIRIKAGGVLCIPPDVPHKAEALEDTLDVDVFSPPREDWLNKTDNYLRK